MVLERREARRGVLLVLSLALFTAAVLHDLDHVRQGRPLPGALTAIGFIGTAGAGMCALLARRRHPLAPVACAVFGFGTVIGVTAVHLLPRWHHVLSDPYAEADVDLPAWISVVLLLIAGFVVGVAATRRLRDDAS